LRTRLQRAAGRGLTKFVGREREMDAMRHAAELAQGGRGQIVAAVGEPGLGKSRLFHEFKAKNQSGWMMLGAVSVSHGKASAYLPVIDLLHGYFHITADDDQRTRREKVNGRIITLDPALEDTRPHLFGLLGLVEGEDPLAQMDAQIRRQRTQEAVKRILLRESLNQPLMMELEDLQWIDDETQALLNLLADSIGTSKILLLVNYRPEYSHSWGSKTYYSQLRLDPLGKESTDEMLSTLLGTDANLAPLKRLIAEKTEGNPLFMEEIYLSFLEEGTLVRNGGVKLAKPLASLHIPPTVQGILASRIDRLAADEKDLLQTVAVIGTEFDLEVARALSGKSDDDLNRMLKALQLAEFIYEQPAAGAVEYTFKHALTHDVVYRSLLGERRRRLHERAGAVIESLFADNLDDHATELAHHFSQSGNPSKAVQYLTLAGKQALERAAFAESHTQLQQGLDWVSRIVDETERAKLELNLMLVLAQALRFLKGPASAEAAEAVHRAEELCERVGTDAEQFSILIVLRGFFLFSGNQEAALEKCRLALALAERTGDPQMLGTANAITANTLFATGRLTEALQLSRRALETARPSHERHRNFGVDPFEVFAGITEAVVLFHLGYPDQAQRGIREVLESARQTSSFLTTAIYLASVLYVGLKNPDRVLELVEPAVAEAEQAGLLFERARGSVALGWAVARQGNPDQGIAMILSARADMRATHAAVHQGFVTVQADALLSAARYDEAIAMVDETLAEPEFQYPIVVAALHRLKGEAILGRDPSAATEAETCFRKAIEITRDLSAKLVELRATTSLARLLRDTNRRDEGRAMLTYIYNWFTEGFDTADLKEAKALLDELTG
jgi:tetratricopeptide (TPR) repeat protein